MTDALQVKQQLKAIGADKYIFCGPERRELAKILFENEQVHHLINGRYSGGFAILVATDQRILLVDKKPFYLTMEDIRYDMISDVMFNNRLLNSTLLLGTIQKSVSFTGFSHTKIRDFTSFIQQKVMEVRSGQAHSPAVQAMQQQVGSFGAPIKMARNPYNMPVMTRNRVSKYY